MAEVLEGRKRGRRGGRVGFGGVVELRYVGCTAGAKATCQSPPPGKAEEGRENGRAGWEGSFSCRSSSTKLACVSAASFPPFLWRSRYLATTVGLRSTWRLVKRWEPGPPADPCWDLLSPSKRGVQSRLRDSSTGWLSQRRSLDLLEAANP